MDDAELSIFRFVDTLNTPPSWHIDDFCTIVFTEMKNVRDGARLPVVEIRHYKEKDGLEHEFLLVGVRYRGKHHMLRIERSTPARVQRTFWQKMMQNSSSILPALDTVSISSSFKKLTINMNRGPIIHVATLSIPSSSVTLHDFCLLLSLFPSFSPIYKLKEEQCYWFCNVIIATIASIGGVKLTPEEGYARAGKYGRFSINVSAKARQLFIDGYRVVRKLQDRSGGESGHIEITDSTAQALVAILSVQSDEAKTKALTYITSLASRSPDYRKLLLEAECAEQLRLIFLQSPAELKALVFLAVDALGLTRWNPIHEPDLIEKLGSLSIGDIFTEEDKNSIDSRYTNALLDLIDLLADARSVVGSRSAIVITKFFWHDQSHPFIRSEDIFNREKTRPFVLNALPRMAMSNLHEVRLISGRIITELAPYSDLRFLLQETMSQVFPHLLNGPRRDVRAAGIYNLRKLADTAHLRAQSLVIFPLVAFLFLDSSGQTVAKIVELYSCNDESIGPVVTAISQGLSGLELDNVYVVGLKALSAATKYPVCHPIIMDLFPYAIGLLTDKSAIVRQKTIDLISDLIPISEFQKLVGTIMPKVLGLLGDDDYSVRYCVVEFMTEAALNSHFRPTILQCFPQITGLLRDESWPLRQNAVDLLSEFIPSSDSQSHVEEVIPEVFNLLRDVDFGVRQSTAGFIIKAAFNPDFHRAILSLFPRIIGFFKDSSWSVRQKAVYLLSEFMPIYEFKSYIEDTIPVVLGLLHDDHGVVRQTTVDFMVKATCNPDFSSAVLGLFPRIIGYINEGSWEGCQAAVFLLWHLLLYDEFRPRIQEAIPAILELINNKQNHSLVTVISFLKRAVSYCETHSAIVGSTPQIVGLLSNADWDVSNTAVDLLCDLMTYPDLRPYIQNVLPELQVQCGPHAEVCTTRVLEKAFDCGIL